AAALDLESGPQTAGEASAEAPERSRIGVELRRETATFHIPVSEAALPEALRNLVGGKVEIAGASVPAGQLELAFAQETPLVAIASPEIAPSDEEAAENDAAPQELDAIDFEPPRVLRTMRD